MKRAFTVMLACLLTCVFAVSSCAEAVFPDIDPLETDTNLFALCCTVSQWNIPDGWTLEGFRRDDLNTDGLIDVVAVLRQSNGSERMLVIMLSVGNGYTVTQYEGVLPAASGDLFKGVQIGADSITLQMWGGEADGFRQTYVFTRDGQQFYLTEVVVFRWDTATGDGAREYFDLAGGQYFTVNGRVVNGQFEPLNSGEQQQIALTRISMDEFRLASFSTDISTYGLTKDNGPGSADTQLILCDVCGGWYAEGEAFRNHECIAVKSPVQVQCRVCLNWYDEGDTFANHVCVPSTVPEMVQCDVCGNWYKKGDVYDTHVCDAPKKQVQCQLCGGWYEEGDAFANHVCTPYPAGNLVYCDVCGGWYAEGEDFRNHECKAN